MLATKDPRAKSLLDDMAKDPLAREIINRVDNSPYGVKGRKRESGIASKSRPSGTNSDSSTQKEGKIELTSTHPSNEWQDSVTAMLDVGAGFPANKAEVGRDVAGIDDDRSSDSEDDLTGAVGQLSINEDEQVRYHGKASGLHILNDKERVDGRNEGGIWRFPKARVWPPAPDAPSILQGEDEYVSQLPEQAVQNRLLDLYFRHVHSSFPVIHKQSFLGVYRKTSQTSEPDNSSGINRRPRRIPALLLLTMFSIAARYDKTASVPPPTDPSVMWSAGDEYLDLAKVILDQSYSSSRSSTCQALLLMGYREVGIGAMAQAWTYIGMAIRMAQDLGMHRSADGWARVGLGGRLFSEGELQERKRIWYGCVIMDKYISTYIGRPLMIFERDFDTPLPNEDDPEELEDWPGRNAAEQPNTMLSYRISCFNASSSLSGILSTIVQAIYAVRPVSSRHAESTVLEGLLDKWYLELPEHLRYDPNGVNKVPPLPHILTLHMQYWCAVLLLHRPFIRSIYSGKPRSEESEDPDAVANATKNYELCAGAANHISSIVSVYAEKYPLDRCSVFLCYYLFTASIMHVTTLTTYPTDPQAHLGLKRCMDALEMMATIWPSAHRALQLLRGAKVNLQGSEILAQSNSAVRQKRSAENSLNDSEHINRRYLPNHLDTQTTYTPASRPSEFSSNYLYPTIDTYTQASSTHPSHASPTLAAVPSTASSANYRWHAEDYHSQHSFTSNTPLSTSVLPQVYSTGFGDDRTHVSHHRVNSQPDHSSHTVTNRYPQYWNDYSTFPQLGQAYPTVHDNSQPPHPPINSQLYAAPEQYSLYGMFR
ncbi:hypothetical protein EST38_g6187 [Candolleomyces aberdarensis]|uniref:Xylanolytic transcriptional activator regulatory domain-containing protein n=1 Tax=Candolleomyces aberdarensis TaxID=2316362 RepID=A0A4Q2DLA8_9AGAR|nr:hypothetical protein EST38_g6187 [Candolleomyces aberdarensis]